MSVAVLVVAGSQARATVAGRREGSRAIEPRAPTYSIAIGLDASLKAGSSPTKGAGWQRWNVFVRMCEASFGPDDIARQAEQGWKLVAVEWERELPEAESGAKPPEEVPFGLQVAKDAPRLEENPLEQEILTLMMELTIQDGPYNCDRRRAQPPRLSHPPGNEVDAGVGVSDVAATDRGGAENLLDAGMARAAGPAGEVRDPITGKDFKTCHPRPRGLQPERSRICGPPSDCVPNACTSWHTEGTADPSAEASLGMTRKS